jgi:hypothetical protein
VDSSDRGVASGKGVEGPYVSAWTKAEWIAFSTLLGHLLFVSPGLLSHLLLRSVNGLARLVRRHKRRPEQPMLRTELIAHILKLQGGAAATSAIEVYGLDAAHELV